MIDMPKQNFKFGVWKKVPEGSTLILEIPEFPFNTVCRWKEAPTRKENQLDVIQPF